MRIQIFYLIILRSKKFLDKRVPIFESCSESKSEEVTTKKPTTTIKTTLKPGSTSAATIKLTTKGGSSTKKTTKKGSSDYDSSDYSYSDSEETTKKTTTKATTKGRCIDFKSRATL